MERLARFKKHRYKIFWAIVILCSLLGLTQILSYAVNPDSSDLIINEFMAANGTGLTDEDGDIVDWIEIYNRGNTAVNLSGWSLTDDANQPEKWSFPDMVLPSNKYLIVFASGKDRSSGTLHTNFKLDQDGEFFGLYNALEDRFMDATSPQFPLQLRDISFGRYGNEVHRGYFINPTPGAPNDVETVLADIVAAVDFSYGRGFYDTPLLVELSTLTPDAIIRYTIDGSQPTETHGIVYAEPVGIDTTTTLRAVATKPNFLPSYVGTHSYIFLNDVVKQSQTPTGFPSTWGVFVEASPFGHEAGSPVVADYEMGADIVNDPRYKDTIKDDLQSIPTLSISLDMQSFTDLYSNTRERGRDWERPASVEFFYAGNEPQGFQINSGLRIQGGRNRIEIARKHSFRLFFRDEYGASKLEYPLFPDSSVDEFDTIILRGGSSESYTARALALAARWGATYTRDEWLRASQIDMSGYGSHGRFVHLYINGAYWGLYNIVERPDDVFFASYFGGKKEEWYAVNSKEPFPGSDNRIEELYTFLMNNDDFSESGKYQFVKQYVDITQFIDYVILNWYAGNKDWPNSNWYIGVQNPDGKIRHVVWDGEVTWVLTSGEIFLGEENENLIKPLIEKLITNPDFKMELADRMYKQLFNDGALTDANSQARWIRVNNEIDRAIVGESARWGDTGAPPSITRDDWLQGQDHVLNLMDGTAEKLIEAARQADFYPPFDPPVFNQHGGLVTKGFELTMAAPGGTIYYTLDGTDPRAQVVGSVSSDALTYQIPVVLTDTTHVKARLLSDNNTWSALSEATFSVFENDPKVRITEIMYNPLDGGDYEFIELQNTGDTPFNLASLFFDEGIRYTFPTDSTPLAPGELVVLVYNPVAFAKRYPNVEIGGVYTGQLSNKGEKIVLKDVADNVIFSIEYDDENGWPISPDGRGDSLILIEPNQDPNKPHNWRASTNLYGSPGADDPHR